MMETPALLAPLATMVFVVGEILSAAFLWVASLEDSAIQR
jgi:hypothetical protein